MKASSESGLWATLISFTLGEALLVGIIADRSGGNSYLSWRFRRLTRLREQASEPGRLVQPKRSSDCGHYLDNFGGQKRVNTPICCLGERHMQRGHQPGHAADEKKNFSGDRGDGKAECATLSALGNPSGDESNDGICHQVPAGR